MGKLLPSFFIFLCFNSQLFAQAKLPHTDTAYIHTKTILENLIRATGNIYPTISLEMIDRKEKIAGCFANDKLIEIEVGTYYTCMKMPAEKREAALAFILGHELAHIYHHHGDDRNFAKCVGTTYYQSVEDTTIKDTVEAQADEFGFFYARTAGYSTTGIEEELFTSLYNYLGNPNIVPPKKGRILMAERNSRRIQSYIDLFRVAEKLMIAHSYANAATIYHYISTRLPCPEIYLNTAVAEVLYAKSIQNDSLLSYTFPMLFDTESQANRSAEEDTEEASLILQQADSLLNIVCERYKPCPQAALYAAYTHYLQWLENKNISLEKDIQMLDNMPSDVQLQPYQYFLQGVFKAAMGKKEEALRIFQNKNIQARFLAEAAENIHILQLEKAPEPLPCTTEIYVEDEKINGINQLSEDAMKGAISIHLYNPYEKDSLHIYIKNVPKLCNYYEVKGKKIFQFIETEKGYAQSTATGLRIDAPAENVIAKYGQPCQKISLPTTEFYYYNAQRQIVFRIKAGKIAGWYLYSSQ